MEGRAGIYSPICIFRACSGLPPASGVSLPLATSGSHLRYIGGCGDSVGVTTPPLSSEVGWGVLYVLAETA